MDEEDKKKESVEKTEEAPPAKKKRSTRPKKAEPQVKALRPKPRLFSFTQYVRIRNIRRTHIAGMRAFVPNPNKRKTLEDWDSLFNNY